MGWGVCVCVHVLHTHIICQHTVHYFHSWWDALSCVVCVCMCVCVCVHAYMCEHMCTYCVNICMNAWKHLHISYILRLTCINCFLWDPLQLALLHQSIRKYKRIYKGTHWTTFRSGVSKTVQNVPFFLQNRELRFQVFFLPLQFLSLLLKLFLTCWCIPLPFWNTLRVKHHLCNCRCSFAFHPENNKCTHVHSQLFPLSLILWLCNEIGCLRLPRAATRTVLPYPVLPVPVYWMMFIKIHVLVVTVQANKAVSNFIQTIQIKNNCFDSSHSWKSLNFFPEVTLCSWWNVKIQFQELAHSWETTSNGGHHAGQIRASILLLVLHPKTKVHKVIVTCGLNYLQNKTGTSSSLTQQTRWPRKAWESWTTNFFFNFFFSNEPYTTRNTTRGIMKMKRKKDRGKEKNWYYIIYDDLDS